MSGDHPKHERRDITVSLNRLGELEEILGRFPAALKYFSSSLEIRQQLVAGNPKWRRDLIVNFIKIGDVRLSSKNVEGARQAFGKALTIARELAEANKDNVKHQRDLAIVQQRIGNLGLQASDAPAAEKSIRDSLETFLHLTKLDPGNAEWRRDISVSHMKLGHAAKTAKKYQVAANRYRACVTDLRALLQENSQNVQWRLDLAEALMHLASVLDANERGQSIKEALDILSQLENEKKFGKEQMQWRAELMRLMK